MGLYSDDEDDSIEIKQSEFSELTTTPKQARNQAEFELREKEKLLEQQKKSLPAFLYRQNSRQQKEENVKNSKKEFLNSMLTQKVRNKSAENRENKIADSKAYKLSSVIDLNNQPKIKRPKLVQAVADNGKKYFEYDPRNPNDYDEVAAKLNRSKNKNFADLAKSRARDTLEKFNRIQPSPGRKPLASNKSLVNTGSSSDDDDHRTGRGGGAQIAPPSFLSESGPERSGTTPSKPSYNSKKKVVPLFQRAKTTGSEKRFNPKRETTTIVVKNVVGPGEVDPDLKAEVVEECSKYGKILDSKIIDLSTLGLKCDETEAVRIFLKYQDVVQSKLAVEGLNDRFFAGRTLRCTFYDVAKFDKNELVDLI